MRKNSFSSRLKIAVFISGTGRLLKNFLDYSGEDYKVVCIGSDRMAPGLDYAINTGLPFYVPLKGYPPKLGYSLLSFAAEQGADVVCLAGFLSLLDIPAEWEGRILNIHPSLMPDFCGKSMYGDKVHKAVIASGVKESGCTVHFCDNEYDHGAIILQKELTILPDWGHEQLASAVFALEKSAYPEALSLIASK